MRLRSGIAAAIVGAVLGHGGGAAVAAEITVVASIKPVHSLVAGVMQGVGEPALLVKAGRSPHDYSMRPSEARALADADLVFWIGPQLEAFMARSIEALAGDARVVALSEAEGVQRLATREGGVWTERGATGPLEEGDGGHERAEFDMHLWLDPHNAQAMVDAIVAALSGADPGNAAAYQQNGAALRDRLKLLDGALEQQLAPVRDRPYVVFHDAYQSFERRYGLNVVGAITVDPKRRPGGRRLRAIRDQLAALEAACVFAEPQFEPVLVDTVIEGTSARKGVLDPLGSDLAPGPDQYFELIANLANSLVDCLAPSR